MFQSGRNGWITGTPLVLRHPPRRKPTTPAHRFAGRAGVVSALASSSTSSSYLCSSHSPEPSVTEPQMTQCTASHPMASQFTSSPPSSLRRTPSTAPHNSRRHRRCRSAYPSAPFHSSRKCLESLFLPPLVILPLPLIPRSPARLARLLPASPVTLVRRHRAALGGHRPARW
jgi:hypothetical protein